MRFYETIFMLRHELTQNEVKKYIEDFSKILQERKGRIVKEEYWGLLQLAYEIKKCRKAHYVMLHIEVEGDRNNDAMDEMHRVASINDNIIRHLTLSVEEFDREPSPIMLKSIQKQKIENIENIVLEKKEG